MLGRFREAESEASKSLEVIAKVRFVEGAMKARKGQSRKSLTAADNTVYS